MTRSQLEQEAFEARQSWTHAETQEEAAKWLAELQRLEQCIQEIA